VVERKAKVNWPAMSEEKIWREFDEDITQILENTLRGTSKRKLEVMGDLMYDVARVRFGVKEQKAKPPERLPNRREVEIGRIKKELKSLKKQWRKSSLGERHGLAKLRDQLRKKMASLRRAEYQRKKRKERERQRKAFFKSPYQFTKGLFEQGKSGELSVSQEVLEEHLTNTYSDANAGTPMPDIAGMMKPTRPGSAFDTSEPKLAEVERFIFKARSASAPGPNGIPYKVYKKCCGLRKFLWRLLKVVWRKDEVPSSWNKAEGVFIPKEEGSSTLGQFRPISLLNVEGKILFGVIAERMSCFLLANGFINTSVQKAGIPGFPGCLEHTSMIWHTIQESKKQRKDLSVVWLDLANAYGAVPHALIEYAMDFFWFPEKVKGYIMAYYDDFQMRFSTRDYTTHWVDLDVGIPMGCTVSPILFVLAMEVIIRAAEKAGPGVTFKDGEELPPIRAFMDDLTLLNPSKEAVVAILAKLEELMDWARMKFKTKKSRSLVLKKGKLVHAHFMLCGEEIPTIQEQPVKSLGRWYTEELRDTKRVQEVSKQIGEGLDAIDSCGLPGKLKLWCLQFGLMPRIMWPLTVYEVAISHVEAMERKMNRFVKKWLGVPGSMTNIAIHSSRTKLVLPVKSLVEEYKVSKARSFMTLRDSKDPVVRDTQPDVKSGRKWTAEKAVDEVESRLKHKEIVGATQVGRQGLGWTTHKWWSSSSDSERRKLVSEEIREVEEEKRLAIAVGQAKQGAWTKWESVEQRNISWNVLWRMEPIRISFLWRSTYDLLPTPANLSKWYDDQSDQCLACGGNGTLQHIMSGCPSSLSSGKYTWRHNQVLEVIVEEVQEKVHNANSGPVKTGTRQFISFVKEGLGSGSHGSASPRRSILAAADDWRVSADLHGDGAFPVEIAITNLRPDIIIWSMAARQVVFGELTVPWEDNIQEAHERKYAKYAELRSVCEARGWRAACYPFEVGCRGFIATSFHKWLRDLGFGRSEVKRVCRKVSEAAESGSSWIWSRYLQLKR
jgi:hypothetical protein